MRFFLMAATALFLAGCGTQMKFVPFDVNSGYLPTQGAEKKGVSVVVSKAVEIERHKEFILVTGNDWLRLEVRHLGYFQQVMDGKELTKLVVQNSLQDKVPSLDSLIGLNKLYTAYKPFLWVSMHSKQIDGRPYMVLDVVNPETLDEVFSARVKLDYAWEGVHDQNSRYPLFNAFLDWYRAQKS